MFSVLRISWDKVFGVASALMGISWKFFDPDKSSLTITSICLLLISFLYFVMICFHWCSINSEVSMYWVVAITTLLASVGCTCKFNSEMPFCRPDFISRVLRI